MTPDPWPPERTTKLAALWASGQSAGRIADQLGVTRSAVMGRVRRLGLPKRGNPVITLATMHRFDDALTDNPALSLAEVSGIAGIDPEYGERVFARICKGLGRQAG